MEKQWFEDHYNTSQPVGYAWVALLGFIRLTTRRGILAQPPALDTCLGVVDALLNHPAASVLHPTGRHAGILGRLLAGCCAARQINMEIGRKPIEI